MGEFVVTVEVDNCVLERNRFGGGSIMVWGAINAGFPLDNS